MRGHKLLYCAYLTVAGMLCGGPFPTNSPLLIGLPGAPSFEEDGKANLASRYVWRNSQIVAGFATGGAVSIRANDGTNLQISFLGANLGSEPKGESPCPRKTWYYVGNSNDWHVDEHFERVRYREIYPGIDLVFLTSQAQLEYSFEITPGADPSAIRIRYGGLTPSLVRGGDLELGEGTFKMVQRRPQAFENRLNHLQKIRCHYRISGQEAWFKLGSYDRTAPITIDPVLIFSTYLGGSGFDVIYGAAADAAGNLYVTGETSSGSLTNPSIQVRSSQDAFVAKLNSTGTQVLYLVYLGGSGTDSANGIAVDSSGNSYVTGTTASPDFPVTSGALTTTAPGAEDAFVAKLNSSGQLQYSTYLGGTNADYGFSIAVDATGAAYVAGQTQSTSFPVTNGAFQRTYQGGLSDCFVSKLNSTGSALVYSTLLGGSSLDMCSGIAVDASGNAYVTGTTYSVNFPIQSAVQSSLMGTANAFVAKINPSGTGLVFSTYAGGSGTDYGNAVTVDSSGSAYVAGATSSVDFPLTSGAPQTVLNGVYNAFALKLSTSGNSFVYSTFVGGSNSDAATSIATDQSGRAILGGYTNSANFPLAGAIQSSLGGSYDAFVTVVDPTGESFVFSSYFGGSGDDRAYAVVSTPGSTLYLAGMTASANFPVTGARQATVSVPYDAFVLEVTTTGLTPVSVTPNSGSGSSQTFAFVFSDSGGAADISAAQIGFNTSLAGTNACWMYYAASTKTIYLSNNAGAFANPGLVLGSSGTLQNSQCTINVATSSVLLSGNTLTLYLALSFAPAFAGTQNIYMFVQNATLSNGFTQEGTWTVPGASGPVPVSVTPSSGTGSSQTFAFVFSDSAGAADITAAQIGFNTAMVGTNSCWMYYAAATKTIYLSNNAGAFANPGLVLGSSGTLQNSQCTISVATSSVLLSGNTLTLNLALSFAPAFAGAQNIYMYVQNATLSNGFTQEGTWTVPGASGPVPVSVTPSSGTGSSQTFAFVFSDSAGAADITAAQIGFNTAVVGTNSCWMYYAAATKTIYLSNNAGAFANPGLVLGSSGTLQNSQCTISVATSSVLLSGNTLTLSLALSFAPAFAGTQSIYMFVQNATLSNGFTPEGTWTVP